MRAPKGLTAHHTFEDRNCGVEKKRRGDQEGEPYGPRVGRPPPNTEGARTESQCDRSGIAEKDARGMEIEEEETGTRTRECERPHRQRHDAAYSGDRCKEREGEQPHAAGEAIRAIHE